ncbi:MAG: DUF4349 domain-containing protein [Chitinophagaceae bacterium]|nr:DUF4349 domain-containing protein [Chitinophagaceae bacterium]
MNCSKLFPVIFFLSILFSCNRNSGESAALDTATSINNELKQPAPGSKETQTEIPTGNINQLTDSTPVATPAKKTAQPTAAVDWDKKIIKTATLKFEVKDFNRYANSVYKTVKQYGGYIAEENQNLTEEKSEATISIKVPVEQFESMMNQLPGNDAKIIERKITTEDVTGEVVDIKSRLEAKKQMRQKYLDFFKQAKNMEEVLQVQSEIDNIQETMESAAGRVNYLNHQSAMSTIILTFYQPLDGYLPGGESPSFLSRVTDGFKAGGKWLADILVGLITLWPLLFILSITVIAYRKFISGKNKRPNP